LLSFLLFGVVIFIFVVSATTEEVVIVQSLAGVVFFSIASAHEIVQIIKVVVDHLLFGFLSFDCGDWSLAWHVLGLSRSLSLLVLVLLFFVTVHRPHVLGCFT
jgi:hypothetical protein